MTDKQVMEQSSKSEVEQRRDTRTTGIVLIGLGLAFLLAQWLELGLLILPVLAAGFIGVGVYTRGSAWFIPGGILAGVALGAWLSQLVLPGIAADAEGGLFLIGFSAGWVAVYALSKLFSAQAHSWALIPAAIMLVIGAIVLGDAMGLTLLWILQLWPLVLIGLGIMLLVRYRRRA